DLASPLPGKGETILLVEDEKNLREAGKAMLESLGYRVMTAANGREALAKCRSWRRRGRKAPGVDLVITDLVMPEMGGEELLQELQKLDSAPPVLAIAGHALKGEDLRGIRKAGFAQILFKPLDLEGWAEEIRQILEETN
ncbi:MAG: response regulator, partial [Anaerolineae bacterium]